MKIIRWMSEVPATKDLVLKLLEQESLDAKDISVVSGKKIVNMRTTMTEVIQLYSGELIFNLSGTQFVLRAGDRLQMSGNTIYSLNNLRDETAAFWFAKTV
jgi:quercetin dioxygenase-like cupin family protein